jgi:hypothetical protein
MMATKKRLEQIEGITGSAESDIPNLSQSLYMGNVIRAIASGDESNPDLISFRRLPSRTPTKETEEWKQDVLAGLARVANRLKNAPQMPSPALRGEVKAVDKSIDDEPLLASAMRLMRKLR